MSWIKIEFQKSKACNTPKNQVEHIDYEKIREITHEVVKEELTVQQNNQSAPLTKEDIQEAVCNGIIAAQKPANSSKINNQKTSFWKAAWGMIKGERQGDENYTARFMAEILSAGLNLLALIGVITVAVGIIATVHIAVTTLNWKGEEIYTNVVAILCVLFCIVIVALYSLIFRGAANDIRFEKDRNYIVAVFSGIVSFVALIISVIALYRGGCGC